MENNTPKKDIFNISAYEFYQFFYNEFVPAMKESDFKKIEKYKQKKQAFFVVFLCIGGFFFINSVLNKNFGTTLIAIFLSAVAYLYFVGQKNIPPLQEIKKTFFAFFGIKYRRQWKQDSSYSGEYVTSAEGSEMTHNFGRIMRRMLVSFGACTFDDSLTFDYQGVPVDIIELNFVTNSKSFLLVSYRINKKFNGETIVKTISNLPIVELGKKEQVLLEDPVFSNNFKVLTDNQIEARYLLTPSFMTRLLNFQKKYNCTIDVLFNKEIFPEKSNVFLRITSDKDFFEIPGGKYWYKDADPFYNLLQDIKEITKIFDALKLDQDIGM